jgi:hypothetical protein
MFVRRHGVLFVLSARFNDLPRSSLAAVANGQYFQ